MEHYRHHPNHNSQSLAERQRHILEKGMKRKTLSRDVSYDSASGEDPLAGAPATAGFAFHPQHWRQQHTPEHSRVGKAPSVARSPTHGTPTRSEKQKVAVVLTPTPKKHRDEFVTVSTAADEEPAAKQRLAAPKNTVEVDAPSAEAANSTRQMNRRGRPKGWKPGMAYTDIRPRSTTTAKSSAGTGTGPKRRGRPPKAASPPPREVYRRGDAGFLAFLCEWEGCRAELHNLATLRRHVHLVHGREEERVCRWGSCARKGEKRMEGRGLRKHMEESHLVPLAWHVGDGPKHTGNGVRTLEQMVPQDSLGRVVPRWLLDGEGAQVTEGIDTQELEDQATWRENRRKLRELLVKRDENLPSEEEEGEGEGGGEP